MKRCCNKRCGKEFDTPGCQCQECRDHVLRRRTIEEDIAINTLSGLPLGLLGAFLSATKKRKK